MTAFLYEASARERSGSLAVAAMILYALAGLFAVFWWTIVAAFIAFVCLLAALWFTVGALLWALGGGRWRIELDDEALRWDAPLASEGSFRYPLGDIDHVVARVRVRRERDGTERRKTRYRLVAGRRRHHLSPQSGVDVEALVRLLAERGVRVEEELRER